VRALSSAALAIALSLFALGARGAIPVLRGAPADPAQAGNAFVEAWLAFRTDLDVLSHGDLHPALLGGWFSEAPSFLLADATRLANDPGVILAAAGAIADRPDDEAARVLTSLRVARAASALARDLAAALIRAGDADALGEALRDLGDDSEHTRMTAAEILAAAGRSEGLEHLRRALSSTPRTSRLAARALGRYGSDMDEDAIVRASKTAPGELPFLSAVGAIRMRRVYPLHHVALMRRDTSDRLADDNSLYDVWFDAVGRAVAAGITDPAAAPAFFEALKQAAPKGEQGEPARRQLSALSDFWVGMGEILHATGPSPRWPGTFAEAMAAIAKGAGADPPRLEARISAAISVCAWAGSRLGHDRVFGHLVRFTPMTPGAGRAADGNLATAWYGVQGQSMVLDLDGSRAVRGVRLAQSCPLDHDPVTRVVVEGSGGGADWKVSGALDADARYFQEVRLGRRVARRLKIALERIDGERPGCVGELRIY